MTTTPIPACWSRAEIQNAAQIDAGSLAFDDPTADALFRAVHQPVPLARRGKDVGLEQVTENDVLDDICQPINSNEPLIRFITGRTGTGKSHLVRWLRIAVPSNDNWHLVYIEKRNTSLRRIIEQILAGIDTDAANTLRSSLAQAATRISTLPGAMLALIHQLIEHIKFDDAPVVAELSGAELAEARDYVARLLGEHTFQQQLSRPGGPMERIARLAIHGYDTDADVNPADLRFRPQDLQIDIHAFTDVGQDFLTKIRQLVANEARRIEVAAIIDYYLPGATAAIVTGGGTDLLTVFEGVRAELARRGNELFLFIEDLVLLHGIDGHLAQALTVPARHDLCPIRAVIAVTTGYLGDRYSTFADRGDHYTMDVARTQIEASDLRTFVGRYLNAGRVGRTDLALAARVGHETAPNKCTTCAFRDQCHPVFGVTNEGHGLFPFNQSAVDRLIELASPDDFDPRRILREVVRAPLEVAEAELGTPGRFPSARFAALLAPTRTSVPLEVRDSITRLSINGEAEISLRAFYAVRPPAADPDLEQVAAVFGIQLTDLGEVAPLVDEPVERREVTIAPSSIDAWAHGERLPSTDSLAIRHWMLNALAARLMNNAHGVHVARTRNHGIQIAGTEIVLRHVVIENAAGGNEPPSKLTIEFAQRDADAVLLKGVLSAGAGDLAGPNAGQWWFDLQARLDAWENEVVQQASEPSDDAVATALTVLGVLSSVDSRPRETPAQALAVLINPSRPGDLNPDIRAFLKDIDKPRGDALNVVRERLTQRKSTGNPTVFDAGAVLTRLLPAARSRAIPASGPGMDTLAWRAVADRQRTATNSAWAPIAALLSTITAVIAPTENMADTAAVMDKFVARATADGVLRTPDAHHQYNRLRTSISTTNVGTFRQLLKHHSASPDPADLWLLTHDPSQMLREMADFWTLCDRLLVAVDTSTSPATGGVDGSGRVRLHHALRALADRLDGKADR